MNAHFTLGGLNKIFDQFPQAIRDVVAAAIKHGYRNEEVGLHHTEIKVDSGPEFFSWFIYSNTSHKDHVCEIVLHLPDDNSFTIYLDKEDYEPDFVLHDAMVGEMANTLYGIMAKGMAGAWYKREGLKDRMMHYFESGDFEEGFELLGANMKGYYNDHGYEVGLFELDDDTVVVHDFHRSILPKPEENRACFYRYLDNAVKYALIGELTPLWSGKWSSPLTTN